MAGASGSDGSRLAQVAGRQLGLVTAAQLEELGMSAETVRRRLRCGALLRRGVRVYAVGGSPRSWEQSALAACLDLGRTAVLSHTSAATLWRLDVGQDLPVHVTVSYGRNVARRRAGVVLHRSCEMAAGERTRIGRLPVTSLTRTIVDLAAILSPDALTNVVDDALSRRLVAPGRLRAAVELHARERRTGVPTLRGALAPWLGGKVLDSPAEARFLRLVARAGLPPPAVQRVVEGEGGFVARTDFGWPDRMVVLEVDGFRWHANPRAHAQDSRRSNRLAALGWTVLHATPAELDTAPQAVIAALCRRLAGAAPTEC